MAENKKLDDLTNLVEQKVLEFLGDPDSGLELRPAFVQELKRRLKGQAKTISPRRITRKVG